MLKGMKHKKYIVAVIVAVTLAVTGLAVWLYVNNNMKIMSM
jgi:hypothetical protein